MLESTLHQIISQYGYIGIFTLLMLGIIGLPIPDETLLTLAGFLISVNELSPIPTFLSAFLGSACGITLSYIIGRVVGSIVIKKFGKLFHLSEKKREKIEYWFEHNGKWTLTIGYFIPGFRHIVAILAGSSKMEIHIFGFFAYLGALLWTTTFLVFGFFVGKEWRIVLNSYRNHLIIVSIIVIFIFLSYYLIHKYLMKKD